ncbi:MAG TPA: DNA (cytosine-5-)-methyltransferase [Lacibacter sp.]|nr:DNA (cytosine-5-)-methyltransferase [Lacibacter sp.]HMO88329.1 DNA (cytosine-5-)-methyltransferase [Lacibacter sp.]HMP85761.1 DNA (cytosine-5-)-methyltransferase [Lacibacter sp.]
MKFIDLFAGLGGFHKALHELGHECVFASELDPTLRETYKINWGIEPRGDIKKIVANELESIPKHDILCAGFPCQPFSKAGKQLGRDDDRGTLFDEIVKILENRMPKYFILENVPFIKQHDNEETWKYMHKKLTDLGYEVDHEVYSPQDFGIPQHRKRIFIVGSIKGLDHFSFDEIDKQKTSLINIHQFIEENPKRFKALPKANQECLNLWQKFIGQIPKETKLPSFPIWGMEFGANYPFETSYPLKLSATELGEYKGNFGISLKGMTKDEQRKNLPSYARIEKAFPDWKRSYIRQSRAFYQENKKYIQEVVKEIAKYESQSWQKLEWNVGDRKRKLTDYILQFRASGIRVKKVDFFPSLVCTNTQIPIIGWQKRYLTKKEGLKLQSLEGIELPPNDNAAFRALGNAVNSKIVRLIAEKLIVEKTK